MPTCPGCNAQLDQAATTCPQCAATLGDPGQRPTHQPGSPQPQPAASQHPDASQGRRQLLIYGGVALAGGLGLYFLAGESDNETNGPTDGGTEDINFDRRLDVAEAYLEALKADDADTVDRLEHDEFDADRYATAREAFLAADIQKHERLESDRNRNADRADWGEVVYDVTVDWAAVEPADDTRLTVHLLQTENHGEWRVSGVSSGGVNAPWNR